MTTKVERQEQMTTGWPPGLLQDDSRELARWFASKADARRRVREACESIRSRVLTANTQPDALGALKVIAEFPITDPGNMDAHNMAKIASDALAAITNIAHAAPAVREQLMAERTTDMYVDGEGSEL